MEFCEAAGFEYVPAFYMGESPQDMADFIEYARGSAASEWGRKRCEDGKTLLLTAVNPTEQAVDARIHLKGFIREKGEARGTELSAPLTARNSASDPKAVVPEARLWRHDFDGGILHYTFPAFSVTAVRLE